MKEALITGITGQDGSYLAEFLLAKGDEVYGIIRRSKSFNTARIDQICEHPHLRLVHGDLNDASCLNKHLARDPANGSLPIHLGTGEEISIQDLTKIIAQEAGFSGDIVGDTTKPHGQPRRCLDVTPRPRNSLASSNTGLARRHQQDCSLVLSTTSGSPKQS